MDVNNVAIIEAVNSDLLITILFRIQNKNHTNNKIYSQIGTSQ